MGTLAARAYASGVESAASEARTASSASAASVSDDAYRAENGGLTSAITDEKWEFEIAPAAIRDEEIEDEETADVVIIGAGTSGLVAGVRLLELGMSVIIIAESDAPVGRGGSIFSMGSRVLDEAGHHIDPHLAFKKMMGYHSFRVDQSKWWLHANRSEEAMNWLIDKMEAGSSVEGGYDLTPILEAHYEDPEDITSEYWGTHDFIGGPNAPTGPRENPQQDVVNNLAAYVLDLGGTIHYEMTGKELVRGGIPNGTNGRVDAVIAQDSQGALHKFVGEKAVVLATGDFGRNEQMVHRHCPQWVWPIIGGVYEGTGHQMALWVGAGWQHSCESAPMVFNFDYVMCTGEVRAFTGLVLNKYGERFEDEDNVVSHGALACLNQPDMASYALWDTEYATTGPWGPEFEGGPDITPESMIEKWDGLCETSGQPITMNGAVFTIDIYKADTIEELAQRQGLPVDAVVNSVERYNGFCETGIDEDFHKREGLLLPVKTPPYYMCRCEPWFLCATGGLRTTVNMQVQDTDDNVIDGLYGVGTVVGDMYSNCYSTHFPGHNLGANCLTFGYVAAEFIAANEPMTTVPVNPTSEDNASSAKSDNASVTYKDGTYEGKGTGIGGSVPVTVTVSGGKISSVVVGENSETEGIGSKAIEQLPGDIVAANGVDGVDEVSGASVTSKAIFDAVASALEGTKA
jgi:fumarate reductase flavoprotein subunit